MLLDQVRFCVAGLGLCTRIGAKLTSGAQLCYWLLGHVIAENLVTLQLATCICQVAIRHSPQMRTLGRVSSSVGVAMEGCGRASGLSTLCSVEASLPSSGVGVA